MIILPSSAKRARKSITFIGDKYVPSRSYRRAHTYEIGETRKSHHRRKIVQAAKGKQVNAAIERAAAFQQIAIKGDVRLPAQLQS
jgi:hypothetical protein